MRSAPPEPRTVTICWSLFRNLGLLILGLSAVILATTIFTAHRVVTSASECREEWWERGDPRSWDHQALRENGDSSRPRCALSVRAAGVRHAVIG
jgi:hypothetical protein